MMDPITAMMLPVSEEDQMKALADSLRGRQRAADFFAQSSVGTISDAARNEQKAVQQAAERQGILRNALAQRQQAVEMQRSGQEFSAEQAKLDRQAQMERSKLAAQAQIDAAQAQTGLGLKPSAGVQDKYVEGVGIMGQLDALDAMYENMDEDQRGMLDNKAKQVVVEGIASLGPTGTTELAKSEILYPDDDVQTYIAQGQRMTQRLSNLAAGLALTGFELKERENWSPFAKGLSQKQRLERLNIIKQEFGNKLRMMEYQHKGFLPPMAEMRGILGIPERQEPVADPAEAEPETPVDDLEGMTDEELAAEEARLLGETGPRWNERLLKHALELQEKDRALRNR